MDNEHENQNTADQESNTSTDDEAVPEEQVSRQELIPFFGDELAAAMTPAGTIYIGIPGMCKAFGLNAQPQVSRIRRTKSLFRGLRRMPLLAKRGGSQPTYCLRVDKVALWIGGIETSRMQNEEFQAKVDAYQEELAPAATQVFMRFVGLSTSQIVPTQDPLILALAEQIDTLTDIAGFLREHMEALLEAQGQVSMQLQQAVQLLEGLAGRQITTEKQVAKIDERTKRLTPQHTRQVQATVERIAVASTKQSPQLSLAQAHAFIYGRLKSRFQVGSYKETPDERFNELMTYLREELHKITDGERPTQEGLFEQSEG